MIIEKVLVKKTLKCGSNVYLPGEYPERGKRGVPQDLITEARMGSAVVEILKSSAEPPPIIKMPKFEGGTSTHEVGTTSYEDIIDRDKVKTTTTQPPKPSKKKPALKLKAKSKPKLKTRSKK